MKVLDRLGLIDRIGRELQSRMGYADIATFLKAHGVDTNKPTSGVNSKMDALLVILMPRFKESDWTDQEVGVAVGRGVLVIPVIRGLNPYGFISRYQGLNAQGKTVAAVAGEVFQILVKSPKTRTKMLSCLTETTIQSKSNEEAIEKLRYLGSIKDLPGSYLQKIQESAPVSTVLTSDGPLNELNNLLAVRGLKPVASKKETVEFDDEVPF